MNIRVHVRSIPLITAFIELVISVACLVLTHASIAHITRVELAMLILLSSALIVFAVRTAVEAVSVVTQE